MKKNWMKNLIVLSIIVLVFAGCAKKNDLDTLITYMDSNGMTVTELFDSWIIKAEDVHDNMENYYLMDLRGKDKNKNEIIDYDDGHIPGAVLTSFSTILNDAEKAGEKTIVVICYTGQTAGHAVMALRLSGYDDAKVLKWGMSGWNGDFDVWTKNCGQIESENWIAEPVAENTNFRYVQLECDATEGEAMLAERVNVMLSGGFKGIGADKVLNNPSNYFVNNYWAEEDVDKYGHIDTAYRIKPLDLQNLGPDKTIVTYCWTGQTSSMVTAYLTVLGYDATSLKYGTNSIIYDMLESHKWSVSKDYDYEVTGK